MTPTPNIPPASSKVMIRLENLSKRFPGQATDAVHNLNLDIHEGEIVVLVGPSGCGKTTTMKMINRIVEPSSGHIILDGEDVTSTDADALRRRIGYVIQQVGLFPHQTIGENVATVPRLLGWSKARTAARVDELLEMVNMPPATFRDRYPKQLSGGQRQRVGVARALGADPAVMLMDEPFGAIDPITRDALQNEFLRLQSEVRKTIVFVTHDIDEALKMGDRIAILQGPSQIAQYDTPEQILTAPASAFVSDFIGRGASLKRLSLSRVRDIALTPWPPVRVGTDADSVRALLRSTGTPAVLVLSEAGHPLRWVNADDLDRADGRDLATIGTAPDAVVRPQDTLSDALNELITATHSVSVVIGDDGSYQGVVDIAQITAAIRSMRGATAAAAAITDADESAASDRVRV